MTPRFTRLLGIVLVAGWSVLLAPGASADPGPRVAAKVALAKLIAGNTRFAEERATHPDQGSDRRKTLLDDPDPDAIVLACSDARIPPEIVFDQGLGSLYVVRTAGNVLDYGVIASIEQAIVRHQVRLLIVLGHQACPAVKLALDATPGSIESENLSYLVRALRRGLAAFVNLKGYDPLLEAPVRASIDATVEALFERSQIVRTRVRDGRLAVVPALYALESGRVEFWDPPAAPSSAAAASPAR